MTRTNPLWVIEEQDKHNILKEFMQPKGSWFATCGCTDQQIPVGLKKNIVSLNLVSGEALYKEKFDVEHPKQKRWLHSILSKQLVIVRQSDLSNVQSENVEAAFKNIWGRIFHVRKFEVDFYGDLVMNLLAISIVREYKPDEE